MDLLQNLFSDGDDSQLLEASEAFEGLDGQEPFEIHASLTSPGLGEVEARDAAVADTLWDDAFSDPTTAMESAILEAEAGGEVGSGSSDMQLSDDISAQGGSPDDMGAIANALSFSATPSNDFGEGMGGFALASAMPGSKCTDAPQENLIVPQHGKERVPQEDASESHCRKAPAQSQASSGENILLKVEDKEADVESSHSSPPSRGKPRDKTTQRKLRNKESARRYREKQVAKRRQLENFTRNLADQNQQLEMLHDKLLSLTCAHPNGRPGAQASNTPLQDINN